MAHNTMLRSKVIATATLTAARAATAHIAASLAASAFPTNPNPNPNTDTEQVVDHHSGHTSSRTALREEWDGGFGERSVVPTPESMDKEAKTETEREEVRKAVDATWASAQKMQEQAVATASSTSVRVARDQYETELKLSLHEQEARLRAEAEEAISKIWETAEREKVKAVEDALAKYAEEKAAISGVREKEKTDLDEAYQALKGEVSRVLEKQHAKNLTDAVNTTWERAAVQEEKAV